MPEARSAGFSRSAHWIRRHGSLHSRHGLKAALRTRPTCPTKSSFPGSAGRWRKGTFIRWLKDDGDVVRAGEPLFELEGDKAIQEIEAIDSGTLRIAADAPPPGSTVLVGALIGHLLADGEQAASRPSRAIATAPRLLPTAPVLEQAADPT